MVYEGLTSFLCQNKGEELEEKDNMTYPDIDMDIDDHLYPIKSSNWLLYYGNSEKEEEHGKPKILLLPEYNQPKNNNLSQNEKGNVKAEYFFFHDNNYVIYHQQSYGMADRVEIQIKRQNGDNHQNIALKIKG
jgi:hypothetical protein